MFKDLIKTGKHVNMGFPIAVVNYDGTFNIAKEKDSGGALCSFCHHIIGSLTRCRLRNCRFMCVATTLRNSGPALL